MSSGLVNIWALDATPEVAYGTAQVTPDKRHPFRGDQPRFEQTNLDDRDAAGGSYQTGRDSVAGKRMMAFSPEFDMRLDPLALYLRFLFGTIASAAAGDFFSHTLSVLEGDPASFTGYFKHAKTAAGKMMRYPGCKVPKLTIRGTGGGKLIFVAEIKGSGVRSEVTVNAPAISSPTELPIPYASIATLSIGGVDYKKPCTGFELVVERKADENAEYGAGQLGLVGYELLDFEVTGKFDINKTEADTEGIQTAIDDQTPQAIVVAFNETADKSATITIPRAFLDSAPPTGGAGKQKISVPFRAALSAADGYKAQAVIVNGTAAYA